MKIFSFEIFVWIIHLFTSTIWTVCEVWQHVKQPFRYSKDAVFYPTYDKANSYFDMYILFITMLLNNNRATAQSIIIIINMAIRRYYLFMFYTAKYKILFPIEIEPYTKEIYRVNLLNSIISIGNYITNCRYHFSLKLHELSDNRKHSGWWKDYHNF